MIQKVKNKIKYILKNYPKINIFILIILDIGLFADLMINDKPLLIFIIGLLYAFTFYYILWVRGKITIRKVDPQEEKIRYLERKIQQNPELTIEALDRCGLLNEEMKEKLEAMISIRKLRW
jgi:ABC-type microcin C transport system permease subunit YejE